VFELLQPTDERNFPRLGRVGRRGKLEGAHIQSGRPVRDEKGAILILALVYIVSIGLIVGALADWATNDLGNTARFNSASALNYAVSSVTEVAIQSIRYTPLLAANQPQGTPTGFGECWTPVFPSLVSEIVVNNDNVSVWCSTVEELNTSTTRTVTFYACPTTLTGTNANSSTLVNAAEASCALKPTLTAVVVFDDYPPGGSTPLKVQCTTFCGVGAITEQWTWL